METAEGSDNEQVTRKTNHNENDSSDSGIQVCHKDDDGEHVSQTEDADAKLENAVRTVDNNDDKKSTMETHENCTQETLECSVETEDNNTDGKLECASKTENNNEPELENTNECEPNKDDINAILYLREKFARTNSPKENVSTSKLSTDVLADSIEEVKPHFTDKQNASRDNISHATVELVQNDEDRNPPEIVVEPRIADRLSSGKIAPQIVRVVTPVNGTVPSEFRLPPKLSQISKKPTCLKKFAHCLLLIIFTGIAAGYAIGGAYLFSHLERQRDIEHNAKIDKWKNDTAILLATELRQVKPHEEIWARKVFHYLEVYERDLLKASALGYRRQDHKDKDQRWTWASSLFFSVSLMTTSGYGPMTPRSKMGRVAALFYSLLGIPLAFFWFMTVGHTLAKIWLDFFQNICCHLCREKTVDIQSEVFSAENQSKSKKLLKLRSNSIVPIEERKLLSQKKLLYKNSESSRQMMFPQDLPKVLRRNDNLENTEVNFLNNIYQLKFTEADVYYSIDYVVSIIYASLFFVIYCIFSSILFCVYEKWLLTDVLYISLLMFLTLGPGCHELDDDGIEIKMKNNVFFTIHLCVGYCILAMILNLIYLMVRKKCESVKLSNQVVFDSCFSEKF